MALAKTNRQQVIDKLELTSGLWGDRKEITDSSEYVEDIRKKWNVRFESHND